MPTSRQTAPDSGKGWRLLPRGPNDNNDRLHHTESTSTERLINSSAAALASANDSNSSAHPAPRLPLELLEVIIPLACGVSPSAPAHQVDTKAAARIARVSKQLYHYALPLLYTCVTLAKPSQVISFARTIVKKPRLAKMTKTLWIGPNADTLLSPFWWPLDKDRTAMRSSLTDPDKLPRGVAAGQWWPSPTLPQDKEHCSSDRSAEAAVAKVIRGAWRLMGVAMEGPNRCSRCSSSYRKRNCYYEEEEWRLKAFQVQRMLYDYLQEWRKRQDASLNSGDESEVDELVRSATGTGSWPDPQLWISAARGNDVSLARGASDLFDHPMLFKRSRVGKFTEGAEGHVEGYQFDLSPELWKKHVDVAEFFTLDSIDQLRSQSSPTGLLETTIFDLLEAAKIILFRLPQLRGLALTGYVRAVLSGSLPAGPRGSLELLSIGPMARPSRRPLAVHQPPLSSVETLHVQNDSLSSSEVGELVTLLPKLKAIKWNFWAPPGWTTEAEPLNIVSALNKLLRMSGLRNDVSEVLRGRPVRVSADTANFAYFNEHHGGLRDDRRLEVRKMQGDVDQNHWTYRAPDFLAQKAYHYRAFNLMQKQWNEEVDKMLQDDTQLFPGLVFPDNGMSRR